MIVAIDGPAGAGKSSVARALALRLGFRYLDTGAMYRALTWLALHNGVELDDVPALVALAREQPVEFGDGGGVFIAGHDVTAEIRSPVIDSSVPTVARHQEVREVMRERQRQLAEQGDSVIEGRDIGEIVAPHAELKVWLYADPAIRAERRHAERDGIEVEELADEMRPPRRARRRQHPSRRRRRRGRHDLPRAGAGRRPDRGARSGAGPLVKRTTTDWVWAAGRPTIGTAVHLAARTKAYGQDRVPREGGLVIASNHFSWIDPPALGWACPRTIYYMAKIEAHRVPGLGQLIRAFGTFSVRRGESDREAVRMMREIVRDGLALGVFAEGTRQRSGVPGPVQPGAAMVALQENVPVIPVAIHGSQDWKVGNPVSLAFGEPILFEGLPRGGKGYKEASAILQVKLRELFDFLVELHELGRPDAIPPR